MIIYSDTAEIFADIVMDELSARNTNIEDFAQSLNVDANYLQDVINNKIKPSGELLQRMSELHGLSHGFYERLWQQTH